MRLRIPLESAWAEKDIFNIFIFISYSLLSIINLSTPYNNLFPNVPATQYPGIINKFLSSLHHSLNTYIDNPACNIPGVANNTIFSGLLINFLSNYDIFLKFIILLVLKVD